MKDYIIAVDNIDFYKGYEVTLLKGLQTISNYKFEGDTNDIIIQLVEFLDNLSKEHNCQVAIDGTGSLGLIAGIGEYKPSLIKNLYKTFNELLPKRYKLGFTLTRSKKDNWDFIKKYIQFNTEYEGSTMIGVLTQMGECPAGYAKAFAHLQLLKKQVRELEVNLGLRYETDSN